MIEADKSRTFCLALVLINSDDLQSFTVNELEPESLASIFFHNARDLMEELSMGFCMAFGDDCAAKGYGCRAVGVISWRVEPE